MRRPNVYRQEFPHFYEDDEPEEEQKRKKGIDREALAKKIKDHEYYKGDIGNARRRTSNLINRLKKIREEPTLEDAIHIYEDITEQASPKQKSSTYPHPLKRSDVATIETYLLAKEETNETPFLDYILEKRKKKRESMKVKIEPRKDGKHKYTTQKKPKKLTEANVRNTLYKKTRLHEGEVEWVLDAVNKVYRKPGIKKLIGDKQLTIGDVGYAAKKLDKEINDRQRYLLSLLK